MSQKSFPGILNNAWMVKWTEQYRSHMLKFLWYWGCFGADWYILLCYLIDLLDISYLLEYFYTSSWHLHFCMDVGPVWYSFMSSFTSSFTTSIAKQPTLCPTLWSASLKTHSHTVKHMVKLQKHGSLPRSWSCSWSCFLKNSSTCEAELCQTGP
jgi:hypothetical protein